MLEKVIAPQLIKQFRELYGKQRPLPWS